MAGRKPEATEVKPVQRANISSKQFASSVAGKDPVSVVIPVQDWNIWKHCLRLAFVPDQVTSEGKEGIDERPVQP